MKFLAILPATLIAAAPALAGPYANIEANSGSPVLITPALLLTSILATKVPPV